MLQKMRLIIVLVMMFNFGFAQEKQLVKPAVIIENKINIGPERFIDTIGLNISLVSPLTLTLNVSNSKNEIVFSQNLGLITQKNMKMTLIALPLGTLKFELQDKDMHTVFETKLEKILTY